MIPPTPPTPPIDWSAFYIYHPPGYSENRLCWADQKTTPHPAFASNPCNKPGTGPLGLCPMHAEEIMPHET